MDYNYPEAWQAEYAAEADARPAYTVGDHVSFQHTRLTPHGYYTGPTRGQVTATRFDRPTGEWMVMTDAVELWVPVSLVSEAPTPVRWGPRKTPENVW